VKKWHAQVCPSCSKMTIRKRRNKKLLSPVIAAVIVLIVALGVSNAPVFRMVEDLGIVKVTNYTHVECGSRITASGYELKDGDARRVCAVSRDLIGKEVRFGDHLFLEGYGVVCEVLDTMADENRNGKPQRKWVDVYMTDYDGSLGFGIQSSRAWVLRSRGTSLRMRGG